MPTNRANEVSNAFSKYAKIGDKSAIKDFTREEIEATILQCHADKGWAHYVAMEKRVEELRRCEEYKQGKKDKWKDRLIGFAFGIISTLIAAYLLSILF